MFPARRPGGARRMRMILRRRGSRWTRHWVTRRAGAPRGNDRRPVIDGFRTTGRPIGWWDETCSFLVVTWRIHQDSSRITAPKLSMSAAPTLISTSTPRPLTPRPLRKASPQQRRRFNKRQANTESHTGSDVPRRATAQRISGDFTLDRTETNEAQMSDLDRAR